MKAFRPLLLAVTVSMLLVPSAADAQKAGAPKPGRYTDFHDLDEVTVMQPFQLRSYKRVVVQRLDTKNAPLPDANDNSYAEVKAALASSAQAFARGSRKAIPGRRRPGISRASVPARRRPASPARLWMGARTKCSRSSCRNGGPASGCSAVAIANCSTGTCGRSAATWPAS